MLSIWTVFLPSVSQFRSQFIGITTINRLSLAVVFLLIAQEPLNLLVSRSQTRECTSVMEKIMFLVFQEHRHEPLSLCMVSTMAVHHWRHSVGIVFFLFLLLLIDKKTLNKSQREGRVLKRKSREAQPQ